jgi:SAM-dependent methyltransferase
VTDPDAVRSELIARWERSARGWGARAEFMRTFGMPVSEWLIDSLALQPGQRVLDLAAGPGDTGFLAAELIKPGGTLVTSDAAEAMLDVARARAAELGIDNVEFVQLQLEWIDLPTASVDAALCRWGYMLLVDPAAAMRETRRVLRPGGRVALAVWDEPRNNPWATTPGRALVELGHAEPPDPDAPGMFALAAPGRLQTLLEDAGFGEVVVDALEIGRVTESLDAYHAETLDLSRPFTETFDGLSERDQKAVRERIAALAAPYSEADGSIRFPARTLVAAASA